MNTFRYGANFQIIGKADPNKLSYVGAWQNVRTSFPALVQHIANGYPWMPALLDGDRSRIQSNANYAEILAVDIDNTEKVKGEDGRHLKGADGKIVTRYSGEMPIDAALEHHYIKNFASVVIESSSSTPQWPKMRVVFRLPKPVKGWMTIRTCYRYLIYLLGVADPACKDASRFFFGAKGRKALLLNEVACLPETFIQDAIAWAKAEDLKAQAEAEANQQKYQQWYGATTGSDRLSLVEAALSYIAPYTPGQDRYPELIAMIAGVLRELGQAGRQLLIRWDGGRGQWGHGRSFEKVLDSVERSKTDSRTSTLGTLFYLAKLEGFRFPEFKHDPVKFKDQAEYDRYVAKQAGREHCEEAENSERQFNRLQSFLNRKRTCAKTHSQGFGKQAQLQKKEPTVDLFFEAGEDLHAYREAMNRGFKYVHNNGGTGTSKTHTAATARTEDFPWEEIGIDPGTGEQFRRRITADRLIFVTNDAQNPTTETLKSWKVITPRHNGRYIDPKGKKRRVTSSDQKMAEKPNCVKFDEILALANKNISGAQTDLVCQSCPMQAVCISNHDWFKYDRHESLEADRNLSHILSLPGLENFDYSRSIIFWDEPDSTFVSRKTIKVTASDIDQTIATLAVKKPELLAKLRDVLISLKNLLLIEAPRYGFSYHDIKSNLPDIPDFDYQGLIEALAPDFSGLEAPERLDRSSFHAPLRSEIEEVKEEYAKGLDELKKREQSDIRFVTGFEKERVQSKIAATRNTKDKQLSQTLRSNRNERIARETKEIRDRYKDRASELREQRDLRIKELKAQSVEQARQTERALIRATAQPTSERVEIIESNVLKQWLPELLSVLQSAEKGDLRVNFSKLIINIRDDRFADIAKAAKLNVFLDATISREDLADKLGIDPSEIFVVKQKDTPTPNLKITQINDLGRMGMNRGKEQERRLTATVNHLQQVDPDAKVIDFKKFATDELTGAWWRDSRGVNDYLTTRTLLLAGTPCQNLADLIAEYSCNTGMHPEQDDPDFKAFVDRKIRAEFIQGIGRPRAHRRPNEEIHVIIVSDFDLQMDNAEQVKAADITIEAASKTEQAWAVIQEVVKRWWSKNGELPTQQQIAEETGFYQGRISKLITQFAGGWKSVKRLFLSLVCPVPNPFDGEPSQEEAWVAERQLPVILEHPSESVASELNSVIEAFGWRGWRRILSLTQQTLRLELVAALFRDGFDRTDQPPVLTG